MAMKKLFLTGVAALFLATGTAHAREWYYHQHSCSLMNRPSEGEPPELFRADDPIELDDALQIQKLIPDLKKCTAFNQCVADRDAGKVKHCYYNDKRWRTMFSR